MAQRVGLIGCGSVADFGHLPAVKQTQGLELIALYDPVPGRAKVFAEKFGGAAFEDQDAFFSQKLDAVIVTSSMPAHYANVLRCAEEGVHVLCEKPIAETPAQATEMILAMEMAGKQFYLGYVYRFSPVIGQIRQWLRDGRIGKLRSIRMVYLWDLHGEWMLSKDHKWVKNPYWEGRMLEGGPMIDCGVHMIDLCRLLTQKTTVKVSGHGAWVSDHLVPDHVYGHIDFEDVHAMVEMSFTYGHTSKNPAPIFTYDFIGTGGTAKYDRSGWVLEARNGEGILKVPGASEKNFSGMYSAFAHALNTGDPGDLALPIDALEATRIALEITESAMSARE